MTHDSTNPTFQQWVFKQWVGTYDTISGSEGTSFSPLDLKSDGTLFISGQKVDYSFSPDENSISIGRFTLKKNDRTISVVSVDIHFEREAGHATFKGAITAGQSGPVGFSGQRPTPTNIASESTLQQWVGAYETSFAPLEIKSDGTLFIADQKVDYDFNPDENSISIGRFAFKENDRTISVVSINFRFLHADGQAKFNGAITAGTSGPVGFHGQQAKREITIPVFYSDVKMSAVIHSNHLHVVGAMAYSMSYRGHLMIHRKFPLARLKRKNDNGVTWNADKLSDKTHWSKELWQGDIWKKSNLDFSSHTDLDETILEAIRSMDWASRHEIKYASSPRDENGNLTNADITSLVSIGAQLYCFYTFSDSAKMSLRARKFTADDSGRGGQWGEEILLYEPEDDTGDDNLLFHTGAVSAVAFGETQILVAACGTGDTSTGGTEGPGYGQLMFYLFDIGNPNNTSNGQGWAALSRRWIDVNKDVDFYFKDKPWPLESRSGVGFTIDVDWFVTTKPGKVSNTVVPESCLAINFGITSINAAGNQHSIYTWQSHIPLELDDTTSKSGDAPILKTNPWGDGRITAFNNHSAKRSSLKKDASGRLQSLSYFQEKSFSPIYTRTDQPPTAKNNWGDVYSTDKVGYYGTDDHTKPINVFYTFSDGETTVKTPGIDQKGNQTTFEATSYPILEFVCYGTNKLQLHDYGDIRMVSDVQTIQQKDEGPTVYQIGGYFDGPVPFPVQNFVGIHNLTGDTAQVAAFEYGNDSETGTSSSTESTWNIGMEAEGKVTTGVGLGFKASYEYEDITKKGSEVKSERETALTVDAKVTSYKPYRHPEAEKYECSGTATILSAEFHLTGFQFANRWGKVTSDGLSKATAQSPKLGRVLARTMPVDAGFMKFESTLVTPGDLESYTAEAIDKKIGKKDYVRDTMCKNAYLFEGGFPYLSYAWAPGVTITQTSRDMTQSFTSHEWSHGGEVYAGLTGGVGVDVFGLGEEYEFSVMAGGGYKREWSEESLKEAAWSIGIKASEFELPAPAEKGGDPDGVVKYAFRAYFLPVPSKIPGSDAEELPANQWTKDLYDMLPKEAEGNFHFTRDQVDLGFACWRIFFLVTEITYREGSSKTNYKLPAHFDDANSV